MHEEVVNRIKELEWDFQEYKERVYRLAEQIDRVHEELRALQEEIKCVKESL